MTGLPPERAGKAVFNWQTRIGVPIGLDANNFEKAEQL